jgi:hypothetical protein
MSKRPSIAIQAIFCGLSVFAIGHSARAESSTTEPSAKLAIAEDAYQHVDFDKVYTEARRGLTLGNASVRITARFHVLLGISAAALDKESEAREHFIAALAISPSLRLEQSLSPKLRGPYLEARGFWEAYSERLNLAAAVDTANGQLHVGVEDPAHLAHAIRLYLRKVGAPRFTLSKLATQGTAEVPLPPDLIRDGFEYYGVLVDDQRNVLFDLANATTPIAVSGKPVALQTSPASQIAQLPLATSQPRTSNWVPQVLTVSGLAAIGVGAVFNYRRERFADEWNSPSCEQPGHTRLAQCGDVNSDRKTAERLAIGLYVGGSLLVVSGILTFVTNSSSNARREIPKSANSAPTCQIYAWNGLGASCFATF